MPAAQENGFALFTKSKFHLVLLIVLVDALIAGVSVGIFDPILS